MHTNWYIVKLVFGIEHQDSKAEIQFDEQWRMIMAEDNAEAFKKAMTIGIDESESITKLDGTIVNWKFLTITDIIPFSAESDGSEIFSRVETPDNHEYYKRSIFAKADRFKDYDKARALTWSLES
jgi:hypothetical protein